MRTHTQAMPLKGFDFRRHQFNKPPSLQPKARMPTLALQLPSWLAGCWSRYPRSSRFWQGLPALSFGTLWRQNDTLSCSCSWKDTIVCILQQKQQAVLGLLSNYSNGFASFKHVQTMASKHRTLQACFILRMSWHGTFAQLRKCYESFCHIQSSTKMPNWCWNINNC